MKIINCDDTPKEVSVQELTDLLNRIDRCLFLVGAAQKNIKTIAQEVDKIESLSIELQVHREMEPWRKLWNIGGEF